MSAIAIVLAVWAGATIIFIALWPLLTPRIGWYALLGAVWMAPGMADYAILPGGLALLPNVVCWPAYVASLDNEVSAVLAPLVLMSMFITGGTVFGVTELFRRVFGGSDRPAG